LKAMLETAGFRSVEVRNLSAGIVAIHRAYRI
jgi:demethylmenaquinone methyltransferase/2-methoxy-6-polyprenyl-1,4-benzoquinol methylase